MKTLAIYIICVLVFNKLHAQQSEIAGQLNNIHSSFASTKTMSNEYDTVDAKVRSYGSNYKSSEALAEKILKDFNTEKERIRALYTWMCLNIRYDMVSYKSGQTEIGFSYTTNADFNQKMKAINNNIVNKTLRTKKAICEGYAQTFKEVTEHLGIQCKVIGGYAKGDVSDINNPPKEENHAWNAINIDEKWYLVDATWGAGYTNGDRWIAQLDHFYFLTNPEQFALTHFPTDKEWLLTENNFSIKEFYNLPIYKKAFFESNLKLLSPKFGTLEVTANQDITFLTNKISANIQLFYAFKGDKYSKKVEIDCNNTQCNFVIPFNKNTDSELYLFASKRPILEFYVKQK